jgi:hypothetical protein
MANFLKLTFPNDTGDSVPRMALSWSTAVAVGDVLEYALAYDATSTPASAVQTELVGHFEGVPDQNGVTGNYQSTASTGLDAAYWFALRGAFLVRRFISPAAGNALISIGLQFDAAGTQTLYLAWVRVRRACSGRVNWLWREGDAVPAPVWFAGYSGAGFPAGALVCTANGTGVWPQWCESMSSSSGIIDDRQLDRSIAGNLRSRSFFDYVRREHHLRFEGGQRLSELERQQLETFYEVFRGDAFQYTHRESEGPRLVEFATPPKWSEEPPGDVWACEVQLQEV